MILAALALGAIAPADDAATACPVELVVLGAGQDAGAPQIGNADDDGLRLLPSSLGLIDREEGKRYLFDATPAITEQLAMLDKIEPPKEGLGVDGVFLTHAHIGHYLGLAYFGREAAGAKDVHVYATPRMEAFLRENGPWSQLVDLGNITFPMAQKLSPNPLSNPTSWPVKVLGGENTGKMRLAFLSGGLGATALPVAHRDEYSETVGWIVADPDEFSFLYLPDIDLWDAELSDGEESALIGLVQKVDFAFIDATFWDDNELPGRDMSKIPHPRVTETMDLLQHLPAEQRAKVHFIHYNHTNPIRDPGSAESREVKSRGFNIARRGDRICLGD
ncbi:MAG: MBL fold metallo-hydrolase [Pseudomonadota bacterium]